MRVILDNIRSTHNVGSIFRTADAAGCERIYLCGVTPGPRDRFNRPNQKLLKVALGAEVSVAWEHAAATAALVDQLKGEGWRIIALEQSSRSVPLRSLHLSSTEAARAILLLGEETQGLASEVLDRADDVVEIPMRGMKESLNVAVAFGVAMFQLLP